MSDRPPLARSATELLSRETARVEPTSSASRDRAIAALEGALRARRRSRAARRTVGIAAVVIAAAASVVFVVRARRATPPSLAVSGGASVVHEGKVVPAPSALAAGDRVIAAQGGSIVLGSGSRLTLGAATDVAVASVGKTALFDVRAGSVRFDVAKLASDERFVVRTVDSEVEVRGTTFEVSVVAKDARCGDATTRVAVREGVVVVRHAGNEVKLVAGDAWPRCEVAAPTVSASSAPPPVIAVSATSAPKPPPQTDLAAQNDLFAEALAKKRSGDRDGALASFDRLLAKWPGSPLAENASAERMRLATGARAATYAKAYLARYPHGFAANEARSILGSAP